MTSRPKIGEPRMRVFAGPIATVILIVVSAAVIWNGFERSKEANQSVDHTYRVLISSERFLSTVREAESALRAYIITKNRAYLAPYETDLQLQADILSELERLTADNPQQLANLQVIRTLTAERLEVLSRGKKTIDEGRSIDSITQRGRGSQIMGDLTTRVREFEEEERRLLALRTNSAGTAVSVTRFMLVFTSVLLAAALLLASAAIERDRRNRELAYESLQRQADLIDFSHDAIVSLDPEGTITGWNAGAAEIYGWGQSEVLGRRVHDVLKTDAGTVAQIGQALANTGRWDGAQAQTTKDGRLSLVESRYAQLRNRAGEPVGVLKISRDETQRKQAEELLRQSAEQRRLALDAAQLGSWDYRVQEDQVIWDERCREMLGLPGLGPASFAQALKMVHPEERETMRAMAVHSMADSGAGRFQHEMRIQRHDGSVRWLATFGRVYFDEKDGVKRAIRVIGVNSDITERKRVEEALRESEDRLRVALDTGRIGVFYDLPVENKIVFDARARRLLGVADELDISPASFAQIVHPEDRARLSEARNLDLSGVESDPGEIQYRIITPDGQVRWLIARRRVYFEGEGERRRAVRVLGILLDVSQQKNAEHKLAEALNASDHERRRLSAILETMPAGVVLADTDNFLVEANAEAVQIWRAGDFQTLASRLHELQGWRADSGDLLKPEEWPRTRAVRGETVLGEIIDIERFDGSKGTVFNSASPVRNAAGEIQGAVGVMVDITRQRQIELELRSSEEQLRRAYDELARLLEQKNVLFQEVQHRVKNNLQVVSSLLSLEAARYEDRDFHNALNESRDRVRSMALMHEKFCHLDDLARIDFGEYVEELARYFFSSYVKDQSAIGFSSNVDVKLSMDDAIPCGLILQELLSNSVKHAFPQGKGEIRVDFHSVEGKFNLRYWDNGVGLPVTVNLKKPESLGLQLVTDLAGQLYGEVNYEYRQGSLFTLTFGK